MSKATLGLQDLLASRDLQVELGSQAPTEHRASKAALGLQDLLASRDLQVELGS